MKFKRLPKMAGLLCALYGSILPVSGFAAISTISNVHEAINVAGHQRMLSQRMVKDYALVGLKIRDNLAKEDMASSADTFTRALVNLKKFANPEVRSAVEEEERRWNTVKNIVTAPVDRDKALELNDASDKLLEAANEVVLKLEQASGEKSGRLVDISAQQSMLAQRMAKLYNLRAWRFTEDKLAAGFGQAVQEFEHNLAELEKARENTAQISHNLAGVRKDFMRFQYVSESGKEVFVPALLSNSARKILETMEVVTRLYESAASSSNVSAAKHSP